MRRTLLVAIVVALMSMMIVATTAGAASGPTMQQFKDLKRKVNRLENRVEALEAAPTDACLDTIDVSQFNDYEQYLDSGPITGLDLDTPTAADYQVVIRIC